MKQYETIPEAIEIVRTTYKGRQYTMGLYKCVGNKEEFIKTVTGEAVYFYAQQLFHDMKEDGFNFWPVSDEDVEAMALMETIFAVPMHRTPTCDFEIAARDLLNAIVKEFEER